MRLASVFVVLVFLFACDDDGEPSKKTDEQKTKPPTTSPEPTLTPQPEPTDDTLAVAISSNPSNLSLAEKFTLIVTINKGAPIKYRYHLLDAERANCSSVAAASKVEQSIGVSSEISVGGSGGKTLCVWGVDRNGNEQKIATTLEWERFAPDSEVLSPTDENNPPRPMPDRPPKAIMQVSNMNYTFDSAVAKVYEVEIRNIGNADLHWRVVFENNESWLGYSLNPSSNRTYLPTKGKMVTGVLEPNKQTTMYLRVLDIFKTDYGMPYTRELVVRFNNSKSGWTKPGKATLRIPKADVSGTQINLNKDGSWVRAYVNNIGNPAAQYFLQLIRVEGIRNHDYIEVAGPFYETGNRNNVYFKFAQKTDMTPPSEIFVAYVVYTNGDSHNHGECNFYKVGDKVSSGQGKEITVRYNSTACHGIVLYPELDS